MTIRRPIARAALFAATFLGTALAHEGHEVPANPPQICLTAAAWAVPGAEKPQAASTAAVIADMLKNQVVLLGEHHDEDDHHRWQLQTLTALHAQRPNLVLGFEMFPRRVQPVLDQWVAGNLTVAQFLERSEWGKVWNMPAQLYLPLFEFARMNRIPMIALNVDDKLNKAIIDKGWDAVPESLREGVGRAAPPEDGYRDFLFEIYRQHLDMRKKEPEKASRSDAAFRYFVESQTAWDRAMAEALARAANGPGKPLAVGIMGSGHVRHGHGVPHQLRALGVRDVGMLLPVPADFDCREIRPGLAHALFALPAVAFVHPEPPRLGVQLEEKDEAVRVAQVVPGSLAERTGIKSGDRFLEVAGVAMKKVSPVIAAIRSQPAGTWLPLKVGRGEETLEIVVKFPAKP